MFSVPEIDAMVESLEDKVRDGKNLFDFLSAQGDQFWGQTSGEQNPQLLQAAVYCWQSALRLVSAEDASERVIGILYNLALCLQLLGHVDEAVAAARSAQVRLENALQSHPLGRSNIRFLQTRSATKTNIGHLAAEPDCFVKLKQLGWHPYQGVLMLENGECVNRTILSLWRRHLCVVTAPRLTRRFSKLAKEMEFDSFWWRLKDDRCVYSWTGMRTIMHEWARQQRPPLLSFTEEQKMRGEATLRELGVLPGQFIVTLHVRDQSRGKNGEIVHTLPTRHRDCDIDSYHLAIDAIHQRGGVVIRTGDKSMKPVKPQAGLIDYVHHPLQSDFMNIYLVAASRFFLGTASGPNGLPPLFGVPSVLTNVSPMNVYPLLPGDLYIPKVLRRIESGELVNFSETLKPPLLFCFNTSVYTNLGLEVLENTPEQLRDVTVEMLDRLDGTARYATIDDLRQLRFKEIAANFEPTAIESLIGKEFLEEYDALNE